MKKSIWMLGWLFIIIVTLGSCRKDDNPKLPAIKRVPVPLLQLDSNSTSIIENPSTFSSKFTVGLYFKDDVKPQKYDVVVAKNGDYDNVKVYQADLTQIPAEVEITGAKLAQLFAMNIADVVPGTSFEVRVNATLTDGTIVPGFLPDGKQAYGSDLQNFPGSNLAIDYKVVCPLDINTFTGTLTVDDPDFWEGSYPVTVSYANGKLKITGWIEEPTAVLNVDVDLEARTLSVPKQVYYAPDLFGYTNWTAEGDGEIDACTNTITLTLDNSVDQGSFGAAKITLKK